MIAIREVDSANSALNNKTLNSEIETAISPL